MCDAEKGKEGERTRRGGGGEGRKECSEERIDIEERKGRDIMLMLKLEN